MNPPLVSVITITRNRGKLLGRCIESILSQTYQNIEYFIVDGASNDETDEVIASFNDKRLSFRKLEFNWPIKETLDYGISLCNGKYITFLDSDDEYLPDKIEKQVRLIESLPDEYGLVYCWMTYYDNQTKRKLRIHKPELRGDVRDDVIGEPIISGTPTLMFRAELLRELHGWKSTDEIGIVSDWELCARACQITKVDYIPESLVNVYENHGSVRQSDQSFYAKVHERNIKFCLHFLSEFSSNFRREPQFAFVHYWGLASSYLKTGKLLKSVLFLTKAFKANPRKFILNLLGCKND